MENTVSNRVHFETECDGDHIKVTEYRDKTVAITVRDEGEGSSTTTVISKDTARAIGALLTIMGAKP